MRIRRSYFPALQEILDTSTAWMLRCDFAQFGYLCKLHFGFPKKKKLLITKLIFFKLAFTSKSEKSGLILCFLRHVLLILASLLSVLSYK